LDTGSHAADDPPSAASAAAGDAAVAAGAASASATAPTDVPARVLLAAGIYTAVAGLVSFAGWVVDVPRLADWDADGISIQPNTSIAAAVAGIGLVLLANGRRRAAAALGTVVGLIGVTALFQHVAGVDLGIDTLLMFDRSWGRLATLAPGRMGPPASIAWTLTGTALVLLLGGPGCRRSVSFIGAAVASIAALSLTGYLFGADPLYTVPWLTAIAVQTSSTLLAVGIGLMAAVPDREPMRSLSEDTAAGVLIRRVLPLVVVVPVLAGFLRLWGQNAGLYDTPMGTALLVLVLIGFLCGVVWWGAAAARRHEVAASALNARLETSVRELEAVFRAAPVGIALARDARGEHIQVNATFAEMLGVTDAANVSLTGPAAARLPFRIVDEQGREIPPRSLPLQTAARTGQATFDATIVIERADGTRITASGSAVPVSRTAGRTEGAIAVFMDVTGERRAAAEREDLLAIAERARADAERANRAKDEFLAVLSHELRSPLNAMLGWVHVLRRAGKGDPMIGRAVETLERNIWAQAQVINDLLDISRIASGKLQLERSRVDLTAVVAGAVESMRPMAAERRLTLELALPAGRLDVDGDAARLQQVVGNVLHNAVKFTPEGGRIAVRLREVDGQAEVTIEDSGEGIDPALLPHVFDKFVQGEASTIRRHGGLGLGLAIVKQLTALHRGTIAAASAGPGRGSTFTIVLPLAPPAIERTPGALVSGGSGNATSLAALDILLVEDDRDSREALGIALEDGGARVRRTESVREALDAYDTRPPDVLVSDIGLPGEDGYLLIRAIREREDGGVRRTLAIAVSGFASRQDREAALRAGFDAHLGKPVEPAALVKRLAALAAARGTAR
jgi:signal transduction histidine kinase/CheY-like chemotaxis protein